MKTETEIRAEHPDWTPEQVSAEVARLNAAPPPAPPEPVKPEQDEATNRAMAEMRRERDAAKAEARTLKEAEAERSRKALEEQGEWKTLAETAQAERDAARAERDADRAEAVKVKAKSDGLTYASAVTPERGAFSDPSYALYRVEGQGVDFSDLSAVKAALDGLATAQPNLLTAPAPALPSGGPTNPAPNGTGPTLTWAQIAAMSPQKVAKLDPKIVNAAMEAQAASG